MRKTKHKDPDTEILTNFTMRIDKSTLDEFEKFCKVSGINKTDLIREAIQDKLDELDEGYDDEVINSYLNFRMNDEELMREFGWKTVPKDLQEARKKKLEQKILKEKK